MNKINVVVHDIHHMNAMATKDNWINQIHPLSKLIVVLCYITFVMSFHKYEILGLAGMSSYLIILSIAGEISLIRSLKQTKLVLMLLCVVGIANPFLDRSYYTELAGIEITGGVVSMATLMLKGVFAVLASYFLIITTSMEKLCYALRMIHIPKSFVTLILLIYRYIIVLLKEVERITQAYHLRAPNHKGIHIKAWGSLVGQLLIRSIDRAQIVYESMLLRGYDGEFKEYQNITFGYKSGLYLFFWLILLISFRFFSIFEIVGNLAAGLIY